MNEIAPINIQITWEEVIAGQFGNQTCPESMQKEIVQVVPEVINMIQPAITSCWTNVSMLGKKKIHIALPQGEDIVVD